MLCTFSTDLLLKILSVVNKCAAPHKIHKFHQKNFSVNAMKICVNGAFTENFLTRKLGEFSVLNAVQELNFSKLASLQ